jgi:hypothetical protein
MAFSSSTVPQFVHTLSPVASLYSTCTKIHMQVRVAVTAATRSRAAVPRRSGTSRSAPADNTNARDVNGAWTCDAAGASPSPDSNVRAC